MTHRTGGLFRSLEVPAVYDALQKILGGPSARQRFVDVHVRPFSGAKVLDAGCGTGVLLDCLPPDVDYTGFDSSRAYIDRAISQHPTRGRFVCARVGEPFGDEDNFDLVIALSLLHHLDDETAEALLRDAARRLRPGGAFVSLDAVLHPGQGLVSRAMALSDRGGSVRSPEGYRNLISRHFEEIEDCVITDMLRVPYSHYIARAGRPRSG